MQRSTEEPVKRRLLQVSAHRCLCPGPGAHLVPLLPLVEVLGRQQGEDVVPHLIVAQQQACVTCAAEEGSVHQCSSSRISLARRCVVAARTGTAPATASFACSQGGGQQVSQPSCTCARRGVDPVPVVVAAHRGLVQQLLRAQALQQLCCLGVPGLLAVRAPRVQHLRMRPGRLSPVTSGLRKPLAWFHSPWPVTDGQEGRKDRLQLLLCSPGRCALRSGSPAPAAFQPGKGKRAPRGAAAGAAAGTAGAARWRSG